MAGSVLTITGIPSTIRILNELPKRQQKKILPKAARAGGGPFLKSIRSNAPAMNKTLKRSMIMVIRRYRTGAWAIVGQDKGKTRGKGIGKGIKRGGGISGRGDLVPIHLVEEPTKAHEVRARRARALAFGFDRDTGKSNFARRIRHSGTRGKHFVRKSARQSQGAAVRAFTDKLRTETLIEAGRLGT